MDREALHLHFIKIILLLAKIQNLTKDDFFLNKFNFKIYNFSLNFLELIRIDKVSVAQYQTSLEKQLFGITSLQDVLKEFKYLKVVKNDSLLLQAERDLLSMELEIYKKKKSLVLEDKSIDSPNNYEEKSKQENTKVSRVVSKKNKLTPSKKKILDFIKSYPNTRTKDIVYEFNALSDRTVKRNLTDLLSAGLVKKRIDNKAVYYYASE